MITALLSFLGGNVFRMIFGEIIAYFNKKQDHSMEIERMKLQNQFDGEQHTRNQEAIKTQAQLGIQTIQVQSEANIADKESEGWVETIKTTAIKSGIAWIDGWNAVIRPGVATWSVVMMTLAEIGAVAQLSEQTWAICGAALGIYLADRSLFKRGK